MYFAMYYVLIYAYLIGTSLSELIINTTTGPMRSVPALTEDVEAFLGIPYAEPPVGDLRFAKPVSPKKWKDIYEASKLPPPCVQLSYGKLYSSADNTNMSEDCLYLNIWIPNKSCGSQDLKPIIIYIHAGGFSTGSSNFGILDGSRLASRGNLIIVTINYRLGALGFFTAFIEEADGNMGFYDQLEAIKWIKMNAENLGGDPENIVLMGDSAGAFSISAHMLSPLSQNLFKRGIMQSGSMLQPFFIEDTSRNFRNSEKLATLLGCTNETSTLKNNPQSVVDCLKEKPAGIFPETEYNNLQTNPFMFLPRINDSFLPMNIIDLIRKGELRKDFELLTGFNKDEGTIFLPIMLPDYFQIYNNDIARPISKSLASVLATAVAQSYDQSRPKELVNYYMKNVKDHTTLGYAKMIAQVIADGLVTCNTLFASDFFSLKSKNVYFHEFGYRSPSNPTAQWMGTTHLDNIQYLFGNPFHGNFTEEETELSNKIMDRWAAFARTGNPNIPGQLPWPPYNYSIQAYLNIGQEGDSIRFKPSETCEVWRKRMKAEIDT